MKIKYMIFLIICCTSFMFTENLALRIKNSNPIMMEIEKNKDDLFVIGEDSQIIDDLYIIPGLKSKEVDVNKSYQKMKKTNEYDEEKLVYKENNPTISIENNKDKIIIKGNERKNMVSIIFEEYNDSAKYLIDNDTKVNIIMKKQKNINGSECINNSKEKICNTCIYSNNYCKEQYMIKPNKIIGKNNYLKEKNNVESGDILLIKKTLSNSELDILIKQIQYQDLKIVYISELIEESY